ncbi:hypothetical protein CHARACLAT_032746 [Characodon lateralis]|uniref:Uncharacterized protein n=1 Tax=Characodon lateralis TaxID=208331 RepID=A0ABU7EZ81_9TELE|nr:hypothetical protein [Characodon lateralis]
MLQFILRSGTALGNTAAMRGTVRGQSPVQVLQSLLATVQTSLMESMDVRGHPCVGVVGHLRARGVFCNLCPRRRWK